MTGVVTRKIVEKAYRAARSIQREYMAFTSQMECVRIVLHPETYKTITKEFWQEQRERGIGVHEGYWVEEVRSDRDGTTIEDRMLGIRVMTDMSVPEGEVELRAVLVRSWEAV